MLLTNANFTKITRIAFFALATCTIAAAILAFVLPTKFIAVIEFFPVRGMVFLFSFGFLTATSAILMNIYWIRTPRALIQKTHRAMLSMTIIFGGGVFISFPTLSQIQIEQSQALPTFSFTAQEGGVIGIIVIVCGFSCLLILNWLNFVVSKNERDNGILS